MVVAVRQLPGVIAFRAVWLRGCRLRVTLPAGCRGRLCAAVRGSLAQNRRPGGVMARLCRESAGDLLALVENKVKDDYELTSQDMLPAVAVIIAAVGHAYQLSDQQGI